MHAVIKQLTNKKIAVLGLGLTGLSCVRFLQRSGVQSCLVIDSRENIVERTSFESEFPRYQLILGEWGLAQLSDIDLVIVSPGNRYGKNWPKTSASCKLRNNWRCGAILSTKYKTYHCGNWF